MIGRSFVDEGIPFINMGRFVSIRGGFFFFIKGGMLSIRGAYLLIRGRN